MKKLLFAGILLSVFELAAQNRLAISFVTGPNRIKEFIEQDKNTNYHAGSGWGIGYDINIGISQRWEWKTGLRYQHASAIAERNNLTYESEYATGVYVYNPTLPHSVNLSYQTNLWQYLLGTRLYFSGPTTWRWYADAEIGSARHAKDKTRPNNLAYFSGGFGFGLQ